MAKFSRIIPASGFLMITHPPAIEEGIGNDPRTAIDEGIFVVFLSSSLPPAMDLVRYSDGMWQRVLSAMGKGGITLGNASSVDFSILVALVHETVSGAGMEKEGYGVTLSGLEALYLNALLRGEKAYEGHMVQLDDVYVLSFFLSGGKWTAEAVTEYVREYLVRIALSPASEKTV